MDLGLLPISPDMGNLPRPEELPSRNARVMSQNAVSWDLPLGRSLSVRCKLLDMHHLAHLVSAEHNLPVGPGIIALHDEKSWSGIHNRPEVINAEGLFPNLPPNRGARKVLRSGA